MSTLQARLKALQSAHDKRCDAGPASLELKQAVWIVNSLVSTFDGMETWLGAPVVNGGHASPGEQAVFAAWRSGVTLTDDQWAVYDAIEWLPYWVEQYHWHAKKFGALSEAMQTAAIHRWSAVGVESVLE